MFKKSNVYLLALFLVVTTTAVHALNIDQVQQEIIEQLAENLNGNSKTKPILLLIGGYPGAGKTTLTHALTQTEDIAVISWNAIRQALLDKGLTDSPYDNSIYPEIIAGVNRALFQMCLQRNVNIAIDANAHTSNIKLFEDLLAAEQYQDVYQVVRICLNTPVELLFNRVQAREPKEGIHQGTEIDLARDLNSSRKKINIDEYALILKNDETIPFETELSIVNSFLKPYFDCQ